jgi:multiple sugar transport system ATP-binding protein
MRDGIVEQIGSPLDLYDNPDNLFAAGFIGSPAMNFLPGVLRREGNNIHVAMENGIRLPLPAQAGGTGGQKVTYGVRPEHLALGGEDGIAATVSVVEPTGADTFVFSEIGGKPICATFSERHTFKPGETIKLKAPLDLVHLFDSETGKVIRSESVRRSH